MLWLSVGTHDVTFYHADFAPYTMRIVVSARETTFMSVTLIKYTVYTFNA